MLIVEYYNDDSHAVDELIERLNVQWVDNTLNEDDGRIMEYAKDSEFIKDFISRTKENINRGCHPYEVTQLINSLIGLLVLPKEKYYDGIKNEMIDAQLFRKIQSCVINPPTRCSLKYIVRRMRNAIAHFHIECKADADTKEIEKIIFSDFADNDESKSPDFIIELEVSLVKHFVDQFSDAVLRSIVTTTKETS